MNAASRYMDFIFARHGETPWNEHREMENAHGKKVQGPLIQGSSDIELNANGLQQAEQTALAIASSGRSFKKIISSPLKRAAQTAHIIAQKNRLKMTEDWNFAACSWGKCEGMTREYRTENYQFDQNGNYRGPGWQTIPTRERWNFQPIPEAESMHSVIDRMKRSFSVMIADSEIKDCLLVVCHQENIKAFILDCMADTIESARQKNDLETIKFWETPQIKNCGLYHVRYDFDTGKYSYLGEVFKAAEK